MDFNTRLNKTIIRACLKEGGGGGGGGHFWPWSSDSIRHSCISHTPLGGMPYLLC